jgi:hypothetical protein
VWWVIFYGRMERGKEVNGILSFSEGGGSRGCGEKNERDEVEKRELIAWSGERG